MSKIFSRLTDASYSDCIRLNEEGRAAMSFYDMTFSLPLAAAAAGLKHDTVHRWIAKGQLVMTEADRKVVGRGGGVNLSALTTLQLIVAGALWHRGITVEDACEASVGFAHFGEIKGEAGALQGRDPGRLYPDDLTVLFIDRRAPANSFVRPVTETSSVQSLRFVTGIGGSRCSIFDAVNLEDLFIFGLGTLGVDQSTVIAEMKATR